MGDDGREFRDVVDGDPQLESEESNSIPEPEQVPSVQSGEGEDVPSTSTGGLHVPVPEPLAAELSGDDAMFGDDVDCLFAMGG